MSVSFVKILTKPLLFKNLLKLVFKLSLLFLPSILASSFLGVDNWISIILFFITFLISNGYLWLICQEELEKESDNFPEFKLINNFFIGIKGIIFFLASLTLLSIILAALWLLAYYKPDFTDTIKIIGIVCSAFWLFMIYPVSMGMFADQFNPGEALKIGVILQVIGGAWLSYLKAAMYLFAYAIIIGTICWACITFLGANLNYYIFGFFISYAFIIYFLLYARIFKEIKAEFESHF